MRMDRGGAHEGGKWSFGTCFADAAVPMTEEDGSWGFDGAVL